MNRIFLNCLAVIIPALISQNTLAVEYIGFNNLCKLANEESVNKIVEDAGGTWLGDGKANNYPIATGKYEISTKFYDGKLYSIIVESPTGLGVILEKKYGKFISQKVDKFYIAGFGNVTTFERDYAAKDNTNIKIHFVHSISGRGVMETELSYTCKDIDKKRLADIKKNEERENAESFKQRNTGKSL